MTWHFRDQWVRIWAEVVVAVWTLKTWHGSRRRQGSPTTSSSRSTRSSGRRSCFFYTSPFWDEITEKPCKKYIQIILVTARPLSVGHQFPTCWNGGWCNCPVGNVRACHSCEVRGSIVSPFILQEKDSDSTKLFDHELHKASLSV